MRVALIQPKVFMERVKDVKNAARLACKADAEIIVFPELYPFFNSSGREMVNEAVRKKALIIYGETIGGKNAATLAYPNGKVKRHFKMKIWDNEKRARGKKLNVFKYRGVRFGVLICADFYGGDLAERLVSMGASFIIVVSMDCPAYGEIWENGLVYVSRKTNVPIIYVNSCSFQKGGRQYGGGRSRVVVPSPGKFSRRQIISAKGPIFRQKDLVLVEMGTNEGIRVFDLDPKKYNDPTRGMVK
ncbi:MAG: carbon-nitrogen hydrolase family protein [Candidatus Aenigmarchaeota archaeon]|nr:carbon-nitrogen hydrolase family protein [Candidatus Aenigmarchaeota archaeon]